MNQLDFIAPMKAQLSDVSFLERVSDDPSWAAVEKFDGYRELLYLGAERNELLSSLGTSHIDKVPQFKVVVPELAGTVLDTEGMSPTRMLEDNASCFKSYPENAIAWQKQYGKAFLVAFGVLCYKGRDVTGEQFGSSRVILEQVLATLWKTEFGEVRLEQLVFVGKLEYYNMIIARKQNEGHEGVILKDMFAPYRPGMRGNAWLKVKRKEMIVAIITDFTSGFGKYEGMVGSVMFKADGVEGMASGMDDTERAYMSVHPEQYIGKRAYFEGQSVTKYGALRHPQYKGLIKEVK